MTIVIRPVILYGIESQITENGKFTENLKKNLSPKKNQGRYRLR